MSVNPNRRRSAVVGALALALAAFVVGCSDDSTATPVSPPPTEEPGTTTTVTTPATTDAATTTSAAPATTTAPTDPPTTSAAPVATTTVNVYWGWDVVNPANGSPERIAAGSREVVADVPIRNSLEALLAGVDAAERDVGMTSSIPPGSRVLGIAIDGTTATVDLSSEFASPSGSLDETMRLAQVVFTVTQFDDVERVRFHIDGVEQDPVLSTGFVVGDGFTRDSFANVRALIMVEQPTPGAEVSDPLVIRGESNTFEANVRYAITTGGGDGLVLTEGFTTATGGNGTWGTFEIVVDLAELTDDTSGSGSIVLWEDSPLDGSRTDLVEIPVVFVAT